MEIAVLHLGNRGAFVLSLLDRMFYMIHRLAVSI